MRYGFLFFWIVIGFLIFLPGCRVMFRSDRSEFVAVFSETVDDANQDSEAFYDQSRFPAKRPDDQQDDQN